jgi:hypothetical protein
MRIFFALKIRRLRAGENPRTWVPKASTLPLDHRSRLTCKLDLFCLFGTRHRGGVLHRCFISGRYLDRILITELLSHSRQIRGRNWRNELKKPLYSPLTKQSSSSTLELAGRGSGKRPRKREAQVMRLVTVLWHEMSVKNTSPKYF